MRQTQKNKILQLYKDISFPGSFSSPKRFSKELLIHKGIKISEREMRKLLHEDLMYQMSYIKPKNTKNMRHVYSNGVTLQVGAYHRCCFCCCCCCCCDAAALGQFEHLILITGCIFRVWLILYIWI